MADPTGRPSVTDTQRSLSLNTPANAFFAESLIRRFPEAQFITQVQPRVE